jgi:hypothetical protein
MWRHLRAAVVVGMGIYFLLGPARTQVLMEPESTSRLPWRAMAWHMYHNVGLENCQGEFWAMRNGQRVEYTRKELEKALPRIYGGGNGSRWDAGRHVRSYDVVWNSNNKVPDMARLLCEREPDRSQADVRAWARCAPGYPGGPWKQMQDGSKNLCP